MNSGQIKEYNSVYPGEYQPFRFDFREVREELQIPAKRGAQPVVNVIENTDNYTIEIVAPGHSKNEFVLIADKGRINVFALGRKSNNKEQAFYHPHELNYGCFEHSIPLPENIDSDFVSAEYKAGILSICCSKTEKPAVNTLHPIIIY